MGVPASVFGVDCGGVECGLEYEFQVLVHDDCRIDERCSLTGNVELKIGNKVIGGWVGFALAHGNGRVFSGLEDLIEYHSDHLLTWLLNKSMYTAKGIKSSKAASKSGKAVRV